MYMGGWQNYVPLLGSPKYCITLRTPKGTIILTTIHLSGVMQDFHHQQKYWALELVQTEALNEAPQQILRILDRMGHQDLSGDHAAAQSNMKA